MLEHKIGVTPYKVTLIVYYIRYSLHTIDYNVKIFMLNPAPNVALIFMSVLLGYFIYTSISDETFYGIP